MVDSLVLHIGTHKTGTTSIQASLADAADQLRDQGVLYPRAGRGPFSGHPNFAWEVLGRPRHRADVGGLPELREEVAEAAPTAVVISSEAFTDRPRDPALVRFAEQLAEALRARQVHVLGYVRPQWDYLESHYVQLVRGGNSSDTIDEHVARHADKPRFDYLEVFGGWHEAFGDALHVRPYGSDVVEDFWEAVPGLPPRPPHRRGGRRNPRAGRRSVGMLSRLRRDLMDGGLPRGPQVRSLVTDAASVVRDAFPDDEPYRGLTRAAAEELRRRFAESNEQFARMIAHRPVEDLFPGPADRTLSTWDPATAPDDERALFLDLVRRSRERAGLPPSPNW